MSTQLIINQPKTFGLIFRDEHNNITHAPPGTPAWNTGSPNTGSPNIALTPSSNGLTCVVTDSAEESTAITVNASDLTDSEAIESVPGPAVSVEIVALD